ncbi:MAG TPA: peptidoglycan DD-metalloendopeptidase family protein, partial [Acidimicrobiales bacterium]
MFAPPVADPIADPFRPPAGPYGSGNRGLEYDTQPGTPVRSSADGTVTFAGPVAGALHVTVAHADGVRTSYSFLAGIEVVVGQQVRLGDRLGTSAERLHFGARVGGEYFDPATLFAGGDTEVELLPFEVPPGSTPEAEALALVALTTGGGASLPDVGDTVDWLRGPAGTAVTYAAQLDPVGRGLDIAGDLADRLLYPGPCSAGPAPDRPAAGQRRVAVTVAGLGSSSDRASIDGLRLGDLGYAPDRVVRFSYAGGHTPSTGAAYPGIGARAYAPTDTQGDVDVSAARLADLVEQVALADPDAVIDVFAHSLGGLVARLALTELERRGVNLGRLGVVVTLASPHRGADAATAVVAADTRPAPSLVLDVGEQVLGTGLDPDAPAIRQLAEGSELVARLATGGAPAGVTAIAMPHRRSAASRTVTTVSGASSTIGAVSSHQT